MSGKARKKRKETPHKKGGATVTTKKKLRGPKAGGSSTLLPHRPLHDANLLYGSSENNSVVKKWAGDKFIGARVAKPFGKAKKWFHGTIDDFKFDKRSKTKTWHVTYDDGDQEDMTEDEFSYWLEQYNKRLAKDLGKSEIPYQQSDESNSTTNSSQYKVTWRLSIEITEFAYGAFDDCYGSEVQQTEDMYRESEVTIPLTQKKELFTTLDKANAVAADQFKWLAHRYIDEEDLDKVKQTKATSDDCKNWRWSYDSYDSYDNTMLCEGWVEVMKV